MSLRGIRKRPASADQAFVGRKQQLALIVRRLEQARSGQGSFISISGEPGIGKTKLAQTAAVAATQQGFNVFWGLCHEGQYIPAFWPWKQMLGDLLKLPPRSLNLGRSRAVLKSLSEATRGRPGRPGDAELPRPIGQQARLELLESFVSLLNRVSERRPLLLVMDNLHCADTPSLQLLEVAAREMSRRKAVIIGSHREGPVGAAGALRATLGALAGQAFFEGISLRGFDLSEVEECLKECGIRRPSADLVQAVFARTEGNPLFVVEAARLLLHNGALDAAPTRDARGWEIHIPPKVRLAILGLVQRLSPACREIVEAAALAGREFELAILADVLSAKGASVAALLEEATAHSLIERAPRSPARYRFAHALIQEVIREEIPASRRSILELRTAETLERRVAQDAEVYAGELARHFDAAGPEHAEKALHYYRLAGERSLRANGFEDAFGQLGRALELTRGRSQPLVTARLLFGLAQSLQGLGSIRAGAESYGQAFELFLDNGDVENAIRVFEQPLILFDRATGMREHLERAIALIGAGTPRADALGSKYGLAVYRDTGDYQQAVSIFERAVAAVRKTGDKEQEKATLVNWGWIEYHELSFEKSHVIAEEVLRLAHHSGDVWTEGMARSINGLALLGLGRIADAEEHARQAAALAERFNVRLVLSGMSSFRFSLCRQMGDLAAAQRIADASLALGEVPYRAWHLLNKALIEYEQGNTLRGAQFMEQAIERKDDLETPPHWSGSLALVIPYIAWLSGEADKLVLADSMTKKVLSADGLRRGDFVTASMGAGLIAAVRGDRETAARHYEKLLPYRGLVASPGLGLTGDHVLALLAFTAGNHARAREHFEAALTFCRDRGLVLELAYTCRDYAEFLLNSAAQAEARRILALCQEAGEISKRSSLLLLTRRIDEVRGGVNADAVRGDIYPDSLSDREVDVLRLVSEGLSNAMIGEQLFISLHTVANHVRSILEKTGAANRTEAAAYAIRHGLTAKGPSDSKKS